MPPRNDPYAAFNFLVEIDGVTAAAFTECSGIATETDVIEYREGADKQARVRKLPGLTKFTNIVLKRGITTNQELWNWRKEIMDGLIDRRSVVIALLDGARNTVLRFQLHEAWPCKWEGPHLKAKNSEVAIETLELAYEGLDVES
ncbi:MAG: phage tail protein [Gemmatimonadota bacterium]